MISEKNIFIENNINQEFDRLLRISFRAHGIDTVNASSFSHNNSDILWDSSFFQITETSIWNSLQSEHQKQLLQKLNIHLLKEAYYIENAGMVYSGKMNLYSESEAERAFFCLMGQEEAAHLELFRPLLPDQTQLAGIPSFSQLIGKIIQEGDRRSNLFLIQILLEGWGLTYYQSLHDHTPNQYLKKCLHTILSDESRHHSAGVLLFQSTAENTSDSFLLDSLISLLEMLQVGPWTIVNEVLKLKGNLNKIDIIHFLDQMNAQDDAQRKLNKLRKLTERNLPKNLISYLDSKNVWEAYNHTEMAAAHFSRS